MPDAAWSPLVDAHHHLWDLTRHRQPWLDAPGHEILRRGFAMDDLRAAATRPVAGHRLARTVLVQAVASQEETGDLLALAGKDPMVGAVVGWVDLTSPAVGDQLDELLHAPGGRLLRAVRHLVQDEPDPAWLQHPDTERGLRAVAERGLGYDALIRSHQFAQVLSVAERHPDLPLVLDHAGKPPILEQHLEQWQRRIERLASHPHVLCKVSGLVTEADHERWRVRDLQPVWDLLIDAFGPRRLMFGSDWPVCNLAGGWDRWAAAVEELLEPFSPAETHAVLAGTACAFYRIDLPEPLPESEAAPCC